jgi:hypothetical protein
LTAANERNPPRHPHTVNKESQMQTATESSATASTASAPARATAEPKKRIRTIEDTANVYPFTTPALRDLKFRAFDRTNSRGEVIKGNGTGPAGVWIQVGRKVLVDFDAFDAWLESHRAVNKGR